MTSAGRSARRSYDLACDHYATHTRDCPRCGTYAGPPLPNCPNEQRLRARMEQALAAVRGAEGEATDV